MGGVRGKETCGGYRAILPCRIRHSLTSYPPLNPRKGQRGGREVEGLGLERVGRVPVEVRESGKGPGRGQGEWEGSEVKRRAVVTAPFSPAGLGIL